MDNVFSVSSDSIPLILSVKEHKQTLEVEKSEEIIELYLFVPQANKSSIGSLSARTKGDNGPSFNCWN